MSRKKTLPAGGTAGGAGAAGGAALTYAVIPKYSTGSVAAQVARPQLPLPPPNLSELIDCATVLAEADCDAGMVRTCGKVALRALQAYIPDEGARA